VSELTWAAIHSPVGLEKTAGIHAGAGAGKMPSGARRTPPVPVGTSIHHVQLLAITE